MPLSRAMSHNLLQEICAATITVRWAESWCNVEAIRLDISDSKMLCFSLFTSIEAVSGHLRHMNVNGGFINFTLLDNRDDKGVHNSLCSK